MHPIDLQQLIAFSIVALAALSVGRRLWRQILAFRKPKAGGGESVGCSGCENGPGKSKAPQAEARLVQISLKPPAHLKRPPAD